MHIKYFHDTDTVLVTLTEQAPVETRDLDENVLTDFDKNGDVVSFTIEHAKQRADITNFSYQQVGEHSFVA